MARLSARDSLRLTEFAPAREGEGCGPKSTARPQAALPLGSHAGATKEKAMARVVGIDHLVIRVKEFARSKAFYDTVLGFLGFKRKYTLGKSAGWSNGKTLFWIGEADAEG